jgi:hypothetical protein
VLGLISVPHFGYTLLMRIACFVVALVMFGCSINAQTHSSFDFRGTLELVDLPPQATPVEAMLVTLHPIEPGYEIHAQPDRDGKFVLKNVTSERYSLTLPFPGRIRTLTNGSKELAPDGFELSSTDRGPLRVVVSLKTSTLAVNARGMPNASGRVFVVLAPSDPYLTLRLSCISNALTGMQTIFRFIPPGKYRLFVADERFLSDIAAFAPRFPDFLIDHSTPVEVSEEGEANATATYVDGETIKQAVQKAGPIH